MQLFILLIKLLLNYGSCKKVVENVILFPTNGYVMALLDVLIAPNPRLNEVAFAVDKVDQETRKLMDNLRESMYAHNGVGLAASQVGIRKRVIVIDLGERDGIPFKPLMMANPVLESISAVPYTTMDGCLSIPGHFANVTRSVEIQVSYLDENNKSQQLSPSGILAFCIQHEIDHLNGTLFIDHLSSLKRSLILQKLHKEIRKKGRL